MAIGTNFKATQDLKVIIGTEATVGSGTLHASGTWYQLPMIAPPTINENQVALDTGSQQTGIYTPNHNQMKQRLDNPIWEIQLQYLASPSAWAYGGVYGLFKDGTVPSTLDSDFTPPDWTDGATNTYAYHPTATIYIGGGNYANDNGDFKYKGCVCKSIELSHSIDSNGGYPVITATFVTGYKGDGANNSVTDGTLGGGTNGSGWTDLSGDAPVHWTSLTSLVGKHQGETAGSSSYDVRAFGYNLSASREIARVGYQDTTDYKPYSYEQVGGFSVSGDVAFKRDTNFGSINDYLRNDGVSGFKFSDGSGYTVFLNGLVSDVANDTGSAELRNTVSFQGAGNPKTSGNTTAFADGSGGTVTVTSVGHGLSNGQRVTIAGTTSYNGSFYISSVTADTYKITDTWVANDATGTWTLHADSKAIVSIDL